MTDDKAEYCGAMYAVGIALLGSFILLAIVLAVVLWAERRDRP